MAGDLANQIDNDVGVSAPSAAPSFVNNIVAGSTNTGIDVDTAPAVFTHNKAARRLYERLGFTVAKELPGVIQMEKDIAATDDGRV